MPEVGKPYDPRKEDDLSLPYCLMQHKNLSANAKLCWAVIKYHSYKGKSALNQKEIAEEMRCSQSSVERFIKELKDEGFLQSIRPSYKESLLGAPARYVFLYPQYYAENHVERKGIPIEDATELVESIQKRAGQKSGKERSKPTIFGEESAEMFLAELLYKRLSDKIPNLRKPNLQTWAKSMGTLIMTEKRDPDEIEKVIEFSQRDEFWGDKIDKPEKLKEHYNKLFMAMQGETKKKSAENVRFNKAGGINPDDESLRSYRESNRKAWEDIYGEGYTDHNGNWVTNPYNN